MICTIDAIYPDARIEFSTNKLTTTIANIKYPVNDADFRFNIKTPSYPIVIEDQRIGLNCGN
jgi:ABC-type molybdate transport system substrate-binding protein